MNSSPSSICSFLIAVFLIFITNVTAQVPNTLLHSILGAQGGAVNDQFGLEVAISGTLLVVGIPLADTGASDTGKVYVYNLASITPTIPVFTLTNPSPAVNDQFGTSVAISGTKVAVGAHLDDTTGSQAGSVYVYDLGDDTPTVPVAVLHEPSPSSSFGFAIGISGSLIVVGAHFNDTGSVNAGAAYIYDMNSEIPTVPSVTLYNPSPTEGDRFGRAVAISGTRVVVGVYLDDTGATDSGVAYVYDIGSETPTTPLATLNNPTPGLGDWFGATVSISGTHVIVGAQHDNTGAGDAGSAYVYDIDNDLPTIPICTLNNPSPTSSDQFGFSVAISGTRAVVGARFVDAGATDSGRVYVYDVNNGTPSVPVAVLNNPSPALNDQFGFSVAIDETTVAIGTPYDDSTLEDAGSVYLFGPTPEIIVEQPIGENLADGAAHVAFGALATGMTGVTKTFTIRNTGPGSLNLGTITKSGEHSGDFVVNASGMSTRLAPEGTTAFTIAFAPTGTMTSVRGATIHITNNDSNENPFDIELSGEAYSFTADTDSDGMNDWQEVQLLSLGFNWQVNQSALVSTYFTTANLNGLYTQSQLQALHVGTPMITRDPLTQQFTLTIRIEKSTDLFDFAPFPVLLPGVSINPQAEIEYQFTVPDNAAFFLLKSK